MARHIYTGGNLGRVRTIHFARFVFLDGRRRMLFISNYDGTLEAYMDDFVNKVGWGLNVMFSNGVGYPRTEWILQGGAKREQNFKYYVRRHQMPTAVWYKAYPGLTIFDLARNTPASRGPRAGAHDRRGDRRMAGAALKPLGPRTPPDFTDIQGLVRFAHARLSEACFLLLRIVDRAAAGAWLAAAPVTNRRRR